MTEQPLTMQEPTKSPSQLSSRPSSPASPGHNGSRAFWSASRKVLSHWVLCRWLGLLGQTALMVFLAAAAALVAVRVFDLPCKDQLAAIALVGLWAGIALVCAYLRRPSPVEALALWDERTGRKEMFVSAYWFESLAQTDEGERLHLARARGHLPDALGRLRKDLPVPVMHRVWALPAIFLVTALSDFMKIPPLFEDEPLGVAAVERAQDVGEQLSQKAKKLEQTKGLTPEEKRKLAKLKDSLKEASDKMKRLEKETPREVLEELEKRARQAEKLARDLKGDDEKTLTSAMIAELERHADTTDLAAGLRANEFDEIANESDKLADRLKDRNLPLEAEERIENALEKALRVASDSDKRSVTGRHLDLAHRDLKNDAPKPAGQKFSDLAQHFRRAAQRKQARRQLQQLAKSLRQSGRKILGSNSAGMRRLAQAQKLSSLAPNQRLQPLPPLMPGQLRPGQRRPGGRPAQGTLPRGARPGLCPANATPVPGACGGQMPGAGCGGQMPGAGGAPVPGMGPGQGQGQSPVPGQGGGGVGGHQAGTGSAPYNPNPTVPLQASTTRVANTPIGKDGESIVREIDPRSHSEEATRSAKDLALEFIKAEEEALDEEPLPLTRRDQVLRYFTELRSQLED